MKADSIETKGDRSRRLGILVLEIGNLLLEDEGMEVHAARELLKDGLPEKTKVLEIGTSVREALPELKKAHRVIVLDAMKYEGEPGTIYRIPQYQCRSSQSIASMHGFDLSRLLKLLGQSQPLEELS